MFSYPLNRSKTAPLLGSTRRFSVRPAFGRLALCLLATGLGSMAAVAQTSQGSKASSSAWLQYSFVYAPGSNQYANYLQVTDYGQTVFNLFDQTQGAYVAESGDGSATAQVLPATFFSDSSWTGESSVQMSSYEAGGAGSGASSVGDQEFLSFTNNGPNAIQIDVTATGMTNTTATVSGSPVTNSAAGTGYFGFQDAHFVNGNWTVIANPYCKETCSDTRTPQLAIYGLWYPSFKDLVVQNYTSHYIITIAPGDTHYVDFYASGSEQTVTGPLP